MKKEIPLLDIVLLIAAFILFDVIFIFSPSLPSQYFITWNPINQKPIFLLKELGVFVLPIITLLFFGSSSALSLLSNKPKYKKILRTVKALGTMLLLALTLMGFLKNNAFPKLSFNHILLTLSSAIMITSGLVSLAELIKNKVIITFENPQSIKQISESIIQTIVGIIILSGYFLSELMQVLGLIAFICTIGYGFLFTYSYIIKTQEAQKELKKILQRKNEIAETNPQLFANTSDVNNTQSSQTNSQTHQSQSPLIPSKRSVHIDIRPAKSIEQKSL
ncbi:MAG: hypothetical protein WCP97_01985 [bacterium]